MIRALMAALALTVPPVVSGAATPSSSDIPVALAAHQWDDTADTSVFTLEGGFSLGTNTMPQLEGQLCAGPRSCTKVPYTTLPGQVFTDGGATALKNAIAGTDGQVIAFGYSEGASVAYNLIRRYQNDPDRPDPDRVRFVVIGNPESKYSGFPVEFYNPWGIPEDTPYQVTVITRQYDQFADWPTKIDSPGYLLAVANVLVAGAVHGDYTGVDPDPDAPGNVSLTEGNVTYVWVPTDTLPLVSWTGSFAPALDNMVRPIVESAYDRPVAIPDPTPPAEQVDGSEAATPTLVRAAKPERAKLRQPDKPVAKNRTRASQLSDEPKEETATAATRHERRSGHRRVPHLKRFGDDDKRGSRSDRSDDRPHRMSTGRHQRSAG